MEIRSNRNLSTAVDHESEASLNQMVASDETVANRIPQVKFVLVVLSSRGMVYDVESLRQKIVLSYPEVAVFFLTTQGTTMGAKAPHQVDLLIDLTGPRQRQGWLYSRKLRRMARVAVGRNAGMFRKRIYDRVYDETQDTALPVEMLQRERYVQRKVLGLAGVSFLQAGETPPDRGKTIALELPGITRL